MLELKIKQGRKYVPIFDLPMALGRDVAHREIGETVEGLIAFLDGLEDAEDIPDFTPRSDGLPGDPDDHEPGGDEEEAAWPESPTLGAKGVAWMFGHEDDEDDDPAEDDDSDRCAAAEDDASQFSLGWAMGSGSEGALRLSCEDAEDDDPAGQCDEDGINTVAPDRAFGRNDHRGPGCIISDDDYEHDGQEPAYGDCGY